ncbi:MAG: nicotinamide mononucleotide transporter [Clostridia bacterium]|nr:nicotinamide mononucleotide transporter [Clostridia bacterium]
MLTAFVCASLGLRRCTCGCFLFEEVLVGWVKKMTKYFSKTELVLWGSSVVLIVLSFCIFDRENYLTLVASLIGVTSLIYNAKGNPFGQLLMVMFSLLYGIISFTFSYYGEMITYLGMTMPMAVFALISWLRNPYQGNKAEVKVNILSKAEIWVMWGLTAIITVQFYYILAFFNTANLLPSTLSVTTSFVAVYLTFRRSPYFALAYASNDVVLLVLWGLASIYDRKYLSVVFCFAAFLVNDIYGFMNWRKIKIRQSQGD